MLPPCLLSLHELEASDRDALPRADELLWASGCILMNFQKHVMAAEGWALRKLAASRNGFYSSLEQPTQEVLEGLLWLGTHKLAVLVCQVWSSCFTTAGAGACRLGGWPCCPAAACLLLGGLRHSAARSLKDQNPRPPMCRLRSCPQTAQRGTAALGTFTALSI